MSKYFVGILGVITTACLWYAIPSPQVSAQSTTPDTCSWDYYGSKWVTEIEQEYGVTLNTPISSYLVYRLTADPEGVYRVMYDADNDLEARILSSVTYIGTYDSFTAETEYNETWQFTVSPNDAITGVANVSGIMSSNGTTYASYADMACIQTSQNITYYNDITALPSDTVPEEEVSPFAWIGQMFETVSDTFVAVGQAITTGIAMLFYPSQSSIDNYFTTIKDLYNEKLGFLAQSLNTVFGIMESMISHNGYTGCMVTADGNFYGASGISIDFCTVEDHFPLVWQVVSAMITGFTAWALIAAFHSKYDQIVRKT